MRTKIVPIALVVMLALLLGGVLLRQRRPHVAPAKAASSAAPSASVSASASASGLAVSDTPDASKKKQFGRPLSIVGLGWDLITPGVFANEGLAPKEKGKFGETGLKVRLKAVDSPNDLESALARGGADDKGADIAILPLPTFVASYERLRALNLEMFYVVGWTRGREVLESTKFDSLTKITPGKEIHLHGAPGDNTTFFALFALDLCGVEPQDVALVKGPDAADLIAVRRERPAAPSDDRVNVLLTTGEAARLIPIVAVAQRGLVRDHTETLVTWTKIWIEAIEQVEGDAASAARRVAAQPKAPEPVELLAKLGLLAPASLSANTELLRLSGRGAVSLDVLFFKAYELWRGARLLNSPPPVGAPMTGQVVASLVLADPGAVQPGTSMPRVASDRMSDSGEPQVLLAHRVAGKHPDEGDLVSRVGFLAGVFPRSPLRITVHGPAPVEVGGRKTLKSSKDIMASVVQRSTERYNLMAKRVTSGKVKRRAGYAATIEVLAVE